MFFGTHLTSVSSILGENVCACNSRISDFFKKENKVEASIARWFFSQPIRVFPTPPLPRGSNNPFSRERVWWAGSINTIALLLL
jgi:hypothetical protein